MEVHKANPDAVLLGEAWLEGIFFKHLDTLNFRNKHFRWFWGISQEKIQKEYLNILDGVLDFKFRDLVLQFVAHKQHPERYSKKLSRKLSSHFKKYPANALRP